MDQAGLKAVNGVWSVRGQGHWGEGAHRGWLVGQNPLTGVAGSKVRKDVMLSNSKGVRLQLRSWHWGMGTGGLVPPQGRAQRAHGILPPGRSQHSGISYS